MNMKNAGLFLLGICFWCCATTKNREVTASSGNTTLVTQNERIAFYNVENLFDTIDQLMTKDEDFTPSAKQNWNTPRYLQKLNHVAQVITALEFPFVMGLCEVENKQVIQDLLREKSLADKQYDIVHYESTDERGIDCALIYQKSKLSILDSKPIRISFPEAIAKSGDGYTYTTRDILRVDTKMNNGEKVTFFVNHWPSRGRDGQEKSEARRVFVASVLKKEVDELRKSNAQANIVIMGDLNDETDNISLTQTLQTKSPTEATSSTLVDWMIPKDQAGEGSYNYKGSWNMLDHIISTPNFVSSNSKLVLSEATLFKEDFIMYLDKKSNQMLPSHTYVGDKYYGGYSDHLPVFIKLRIQN